METESEDQKLILPVRITIYHAAQDDPKKNTALRLKRRGIARIVTSARFLPKRAIILNPFGEIAFSRADKERLESIEATLGEKPSSVDPDANWGTLMRDVRRESS